MYLARQTLDCVVHYNIGVEDGRTMTTVREGLEQARINTESIDPASMLALAWVLSDIAQRLPLKDDAERAS